MSRQKPLAWLFSGTRGLRLGIAALVVGNAVFSVSGVGFALLCRAVIDCAVAGDRAGLIGSGAWLAGIVALQFLLRLFCNGIDESTRARYEIKLREKIFSSLLRKEYERVSLYHSGELLNRLFSDISVVADGVTGLLPALVSLVTRLVCAAAAMIALDGSFAALFLAAGLFLFLTARLFRGRIKRLHKEVQEREGRVRSFLQETIEGLLTVKVFGSEEKMLRLNRENQEAHYRSRLKRRSVSIAANAGFGLVFQAGYLYAMIRGAFGILDGTMSYGTLTAVLQLVNQIQSPFAGLSSLLPRYYGTIASAERLIELEELADEPKADKTLPPERFARLAVEGLTFSYGENRVITSADFAIRRGESVSITGISGGGKTTLFLLLLGAYRPTGGAVRFYAADDEVFRAGKETRGLFAYVPQGGCLFSGTIADNISFLREGATPGEVREAAAAACALEFIESLPDGFETRIGENGFGISEGQAQRIAVARAILSGAPILLLDEATSALDEETEARLIGNIGGFRDRTLIAVTHRPAALKICTRHFKIKDGEIYEE
ncbi:MAG: ABC transporter ATP-binding protein/permease [Bacteroides sp.]|nr:ABC transporter ATP-binding protein/permease [Eubacterium sp.]MCM1418083.1 ABC transporter ATP-binding protein/permease [Roseburia sp.]MCM1462227.1 ABC transporter ATP-binding protein/permease [Bacteroides sp.]